MIRLPARPGARAARSHLLALSILAATGCAQAPAPPSSDVAETAAPMPLTEKAFDDLVRDASLAGAYIVIRKGDQTLFEREAGNVNADTVMPIASASKWIGGTIVMSEVEKGAVSLDTTAGQYFPGLPEDKASMTLAQMFSHTSGMIAIDKPVDLAVNPYSNLQAEAARVLAAHSLVRPPGTAFGYGGSSMMAAGAMLEKATGKSWTDLSARDVTGPLGMTATFWFSPMPQMKLEPGKPVTAPNIQAGVHTPANDYMKFLATTAYKGQAPGQPRILKEETVARMERARTIGADVFLTPPGVADGWNYAVGFWCETVAADGRCTVMSSPGAFGFYPWINRENGTYGVFAVKDRLPNVSKGVWAIRAAAETELGLSLSGP